jgi:hypothetical protein
MILRMYDPRANVVVSLSVSRPEEPEVVSIIVVMYDPLFDLPCSFGNPGGIGAEIDAVGVAGAGVGAAGVRGTGGYDDGVEAGAVEIGAVGVGGEGGYDDGAGCGLLVLVDVSGVCTAGGKLVYDIETFVRAVTPILTVPLPPPYEVQFGTVR